ncbi:ATP-dependent permease MDL1 [Kluyveromyces marxianus]|uniref:ATP-dependent permease MDL1 n=2 Tax=Kluyveromyces marxianus TaxID=4911 RepID=W0T4G1_KLUMD|nr:ATP-dependent permease MDL1 [Kluyveromyces marxianus DMKU3-1042]QGN14117.1 ATP-dependent permease MDL1 [Kluyveromyces marxianus]BAO37711.1 ATP-dependent permease MDL1 [Kluyveromyces marxianus DMKU3-1042]BAP69279.1 ATP-dependent permease MDL1 [Kluyveromyces marxianus]
MLPLLFSSRYGTQGLQLGLKRAKTLYTPVINVRWRVHPSFGQSRSFSQCKLLWQEEPKSDRPTLKDRVKELRLSPNDSKASGWQDIKRLFLLAKPETKSMLVALLLIIVSSAVSMAVPSVIGKLMDIAKDEHEQTGEEKEETKIFGLSSNQFYAALGGIFVIGALANVGRIVILKVTGERLVARLRTRTMKAALQQDATFLDHNRVGDLISRLSSDAGIVSKSVTQNLSDGTRAVIQGFVGFGMMSYISWKLTCVMMLLAPPLGVMALVYGKRIRNLSRQLQTSVGELTKVSEEQLSATKTIQAYCGEKKEIHRYADEVRRVFDVGFKEALTSGAFFGVTGFVGNVALLALLLTGTSMIKTGLMTVGDLSSFMMYAVYTGSSLFGLSSFYSELMKGAGAAARVFELNDRKPLIHPTIGKDPITLENKPIQFNHVKFSYPTRPEHQIFQDLTFTINPGEHVCIVGPSGGGKSTVASLLLRYYDVNSGEIKIGNDNIKTFNLRKYRRLLGVVQQEPMLFSGTILENILYAVPKELTKNETLIGRAIGQANCTKFLSNFPDGLQTTVGPRGTQLSGGQKQRIALARAFLLDPSILILDEATSALDSQSEEVVAQSLLLRSLKGKTTISIAHRVSTIQHSSRVIVLNKQGTVAETGPFDKLIAIPDSNLNKLLSKEQDTEEDEPSDSEPAKEKQ